MGNYMGKRDHHIAGNPSKDVEMDEEEQTLVPATESPDAGEALDTAELPLELTLPQGCMENIKPNVREEKNKTNADHSQESVEDNEVFDTVPKTEHSTQGEADVNQNNGTSSKSTAVTDSTGTADSKNAWTEANPAASSARPHLTRLFSRDAPGREDNTFKDRPSESDELQTIPEDSGATCEDSDLMASQKHSGYRHGAKQMASASTSDHSRHGYGAHGRHRDSGLLDSLGRFFGGERERERHRRGSGKEMGRVSHVSTMPQRSSHHAHGRHSDDNPVVHFFRNIVSPRTPPPMQPKGGEGQRHGYGYGYGTGPRSSDYYRSSHKGHKDVHRDGQSTLSKIFNLRGRDSRSASPAKRRI
uniref:Myelin basic protein n=1 Tax=Geotrypetes seraphini TaxID=260995 RepID=A0A6P8PPN0_GEOSA|nr:myelin basic protein isoform X2 [Geotrypetes seraphini]